MEVKIQKRSNPEEIRTSSSISKSLNVKKNNILNVDQKSDKTITSVSTSKKVSLRDRFKEFNDKNLSKAFSWDDSIGREIW